MRKINFSNKFKQLLVISFLALSNLSLLNAARHYIYGQADFDNFVNQVNGGNSYQGDTVYLKTSSITATVPIGNDWYRPFCGTFDGDSNSVYIYMDRSNISGSGLFGCAAYGAVIKNVVVYGYSRANDGAGGILAGGGGPVTIMNCTNYATVVVETGYAGGIIGAMWYSPTIINCTNAGSISGNWSIGGIVGSAEVESTIRNCTNVGTVHSNWGMVGGIVGNMGYPDASYLGTSIVEHCMNAGFVSASVIIGGIVGMSSGHHDVIRNCLNVGVVYGDIEADNGFGTPPGSGSTTGAILGTSVNKNTSIRNCAYDRQMYYDRAKQANPTGNPQLYTGVGGVPDNNNNTQGFNTAGMLGYSLYSKLGYSYWDYNSGAYPTLDSAGTCICGDELRYVAGSPLLFSSTSNTVNYVDRAYSGGKMLNNNNIVWSAQKLPFGRNPSQYTNNTLYASATCPTIGVTIRKEIPIQIPLANPLVPDVGAYFKTQISASEIESGFSFTVSEVHPTVATNNVSFDISTQKEGDLLVTLWDITGTKVMDIETAFMEENSQRKIQINNISSLTTGTYYIAIQFDKQLITRKFVKI